MTINSLDVARFGSDHDPALMTVARGHGKQRFLAWLKELAKDTEQLHRTVRSWRISPPQPAAPKIAGVRWACTSPTGYVSLSPVEEMFRSYTRGMADGLAGRPYRETTTPDILDMIIKAKEAAR